MKLSIITINYNNASGLLKTARSIASLTFNDYEWLVIDGGNIDSSLQIIKEYNHLISYSCSEPDNGIYNAMNKGITKSKGEYLIFMNSGDCFYSPDILDMVFLGKTDSDILYGNILYVYKDREELKKAPSELTLRFLYEYTIYHQASFIKRTLFIASEGYDEKLKIVSDWKMWLIWILQNRKFQYINKIICRFDAYGISTDNEAAVSTERIKVFEEVLPPGVKELFDEIYAYEAIIHYQPQLFWQIHTNKWMCKFINGIMKVLALVINSQSIKLKINNE